MGEVVKGWFIHQFVQRFSSVLIVCCYFLPHLLMLKKIKRKKRKKSLAASLFYSAVAFKWTDLTKLPGKTPLFCVLYLQILARLTEPC